MPPYDPWEEEHFKPERPDNGMHCRNYPARLAVEVLEQLVKRFRDLEWIPVRYDGAAPKIAASYYIEHEIHPNAVCVYFCQSCMDGLLSCFKVH